MGRYFYSVTATLANEVIAGQYVDWLINGHTRAVVDAGASRAEVVRHEVPPEASNRRAAIKIETVYVFPDRAAYERYLRESAPALRADGLRRFGPEALGADAVTFERREGEVVARFE